MGGRFARKQKALREDRAFAGRGEKGGLFVLLYVEGMIADMVFVVAQMRYNEGVIRFTLWPARPGAISLD